MGWLLGQNVWVWMPLEVCLRLEIGVEVCLWMRSRVMLLKVLFRNEELSALLALIKFTALFSGQFEEILVRRKRFLLQPELFLQDCVLRLLPLDCISDLRSLLVRLLVVQIKRFGQRFKIVLGVDEILDAHLT